MTNSNLIKSLIVIFTIFGIVYSTDNDYAQCKAYLDDINSKIAAKQFAQIPLSFRQTVLYSGKQLNDQGDVGKCRSLSNMTFVRTTISLGGLDYFRGYCMDEVCNAEVLDSNSNDAKAEFMKILNTIMHLFQNKDKTDVENESSSQQDLTADPVDVSITFTPYEEDTSSLANAATIIGIFSISVCVIASITGPILKELQNKKKKALIQDDTRYQTLINYAAQGAPSMVSNSNSQISKPSISQSGSSPTVSLNSNNLSQVSGQSQKPRREPMWWRVLQCWNVKENVAKMFTLKSNNDDLLVFNGIRSLCFMQVIFGHEFYLHMNYMGNPNDLMIEQDKPFILFLFACLYSVDVFFWLGGFFLAYVVADEKQTRNFSFKKPIKPIMGFVFAIINRVFRILPCYFVVLMFFWKIAPYFGSSPTWDVFMNASSNCDARWWQNLLFIDNMFPGQKEKCFGWGWYLSNDFQMFIVGMILLIIYQNNRFIGKVAIGLCFIAFQGVSIGLSYKWNFRVPCNVMNLAVDHYYDDYYTKPWTRVSPYFIGLFFGILYKEHQYDKTHNKKNSILTKVQKLIGESFWKWIIYSIGLAILFFLMFGPRPLQVHGLDYWSNSFQNFWFGSCRTFYVIGVTFLVLPGILGSKDLIVKFFSCKLFSFLQRLSFGGYLTHYIIILYTLWNTKDAVYYDTENLIGLFFSEFLLTLCAAAIVALIIEIPIMNLSGILLGGKKPSSSGPQKLERVKPEELVADQNNKSLNINKSQATENDSSYISQNAKSMTVQSNQIRQAQ